MLKIVAFEQTIRKGIRHPLISLVDALFSCQCPFKRIIAQIGFKTYFKLLYTGTYCIVAACCDKTKFNLINTKTEYYKVQYTVFEDFLSIIS
jgi:hypothetical protein